MTLLFRELGMGERLFESPSLQGSLLFLFRLPTGPAEPSHLSKVAAFLSKVSGGNSRWPPAPWFNALPSPLERGCLCVSSLDSHADALHHHHHTPTPFL